MTAAAAAAVELDRYEEGARAELRALIDERGWTMVAAARRIGISAAVASRWLRGVYPGDNDRIAMLVRRLLDAERDAPAPAPSGLDRHADLAVTEQIAGVAAHAHVNADLVVVHGAAGSGKTWALERYCEEQAGAWMATMSPAQTTAAAVLALIATAIEGSAPEKSAARLERAVVARLSAGMKLLVVDEAHHLGQPLLDVVRCVHDRARCGLVLCGNDPLWGRLAAGERAAQLVSRVGLRHHLRRPADTDVLALAETLTGRRLGSGARSAALGVGAGVGALRSVRKLVAQAQILARGDGRDRPSDEDLVGAAELLGS